MQKRYSFPLVLGLLALITGFINHETHDAQKEKWVSLFDGKSTKGWHSYGKSTAGSAWKAQDGTLHLDPSNKKGWQIEGGGDLVTNEEYESFHLQLEWKIAPNGNSGIIFLIHEDTAKYSHTWMTGLEMQVLDNDGHADGKIKKHRAGDLYDLISANPETVKAPGEWNLAEIILHDGHLTYKLNGVNVVQTTLWNDAWKELVAGSKFKSMAGYGTYRKGKIALQDHGDAVWYRNIRIRKL